MKKYILTFIFGFILIQVVVSQTTEQKISIIDKHRKEIDDNINNFRMVVRGNDSIGYRYLYMKNNELQLTIGTYHAPTEKNKDNWYLYNGKLMFCEIVIKNADKKDSITIDKYYFDNGKLIAWYENGKFLDTNSVKYKNAAAGLPSMEEVLLKDAKE